MDSKLSSEELRIMQIFSASTLRLLKSKGLTQQKLAADIGARPSAVSRWLKCHAIPNAVWAVKIADRLEASMDEMFERNLNDPKPKICDYAKRILKLAGGDDPGVQKRAAARRKKTAGAKKTSKKG